MPNHRPRGFTLVELLTTLLLLSILAHLAVPALAQLRQNARDEAATEELLTLLNHARSQAVQQRRSLLLCPSSDGKNCQSDWNLPWLLQSLEQQPLSWSAPYAGQNRLRWAGFTGHIRFHSNGTSPLSNGRFFICADRQITQQLVINRQGRIRRASPEENRQESSRCL